MVSDMAVFFVVAMAVNYGLVYRKSAFVGSFVFMIISMSTIMFGDTQEYAFFGNLFLGISVLGFIYAYYQKQAIREKSKKKEKTALRYWFK